ncbi:hypothetical protein FH972_025736 [Carpinus fangiana]|uniref:non-specific serine/threonine protein kinase n=1 Tax=Carpinus fangiana TaxID=176857 RepID=A0A5N6L252_9ROSI|nr:hypothetical protein FH972_025736 [Carpinus fangiana]
MASALDEEDLALSINPSHTRRGSTRGDASVVSETPTPPTGGLQPRAHGLQRANQRLGQYHVLRTLGEGSFGKVKLAVHQTTGQQVALKIISRRKLMARDMAGRIEREIQYLQLLRHPHIIKLYTVITTPAEIIMVLEYAGSELFQYIVDHGAMREAKARKFFQQIVCAVEYCHRHKIVHRDLKPENLLLDENLHVKIADFGLSNIMTDGNFLKTSCGSPNYAAPEVISGKLYAGPEVDVWSCGVILYVLLVGKLPFDDEYIPALFRKIAQGNYRVPSDLSPGATRLIKKMLQVSPVYRIDIAQIREDPWFTQDLPDYLKPPVQDFLDTGVDPNKAIDFRALAPTQPPEVQDKIHNAVVGKLGKTMGYGAQDVTQALRDETPNAIKDAYMIVRENQIMKDTPSMANDPQFQPFLASPPVHAAKSPIAQVLESDASILASSPQPRSSQSSDRPRLGSASGFGSQGKKDAQGFSTIGVLPSSLPEYHQAYMRGQPQKPTSGFTTDDDAKQSAEQQAATARRLKGSSNRNSHTNLDKAGRPESLTPINQPASQKKPRPTKWQFGIRSRNQPAEAMLAIYKALKQMGAEWEVPRIRRPGGREEGQTSEPGSGAEDEDGSGALSEEYDSEEDGRDHKRDSNGTTSTDSSDAIGRGQRGRETHRVGSWNDWGYRVPHDPWIINARFRKDGMLPSGARNTGSAYSSRADLQLTPASGAVSGAASVEGSTAGSGQVSAHGSDTALNRDRRSSTLSSADGDRKGAVTPQSRPDSSAAGRPRVEESAYVYMTIQLYSIEKEFYLVDFKCAGYEKLVRRAKAEVKSQFSPPSSAPKGQSDGQAGENGSEHAEQAPAQHDGQAKRVTADGFECSGRAAEEKDVSSPFPFLDVASRLIIQLAEAE